MRIYKQKNLPLGDRLPRYGGDGAKRQRGSSGCALAQTEGEASQASHPYRTVCSGFFRFKYTIKPRQRSSWTMEDSGVARPIWNSVALAVRLMR